jgi:hypothetical protein
MASLQIVIPPVQGAPQAQQAIAGIGTAAATTTGQVNQATTAIGKTGQTATTATGGLTGFNAALTRSSAAAQLLFSGLGPLGAQTALLTGQFQRVIGTFTQFSTLTQGHVTRQQVLNAAFQQGAIGAATMEAALAKVASTTQTAQTVTQTYTVAQQALSAAQTALKDEQIILAQRRLDLLNARATGDTKAIALAERDYQAQLVQTTESTIAVRQATQTMVPLKQQAAVATREQAAAEQVLNEANAASVLSMTAILGIIAAVIAILATLAAGIIAAAVAWKLFSEALAAGGKLQQARITLDQISESARNTGVMLDQLEEIAAKSGGRFNLTELTDAAVKIKSIGNAVQDVNPLLNSFAELASRTATGSIDAIVAVYDRAVTQIQNTGVISARAMVGFAKEGVNLIQMLRNTGVDVDALRTKSGALRLTYDQLNAAFIEGTRNMTAMEQRAASFSVIINTMRTLWEQALAKFGEPIAVALEPALNKVKELMPQIRNAAEEAGNKIAHIVDALTLIAREQGWQTALQAAFQLTFINIANMIVSTLITAFLKVAAFLPTILNPTLLFTQLTAQFGPALAKTLYDAWKNNQLDAEHLGALLAESMLKGFGSQVGGLQKIIDDAMKRTGAAEVQIFTTGKVTQGPRAVTPGAQTFPKPFETQVAPPWVDTFKSDLSQINDMWATMSDIQSHSGTELERNRRLMDEMLKTADSLFDPSQLKVYVEQLKAAGVANADLIIKQAEQYRQQKAIDEEIKIGSASAWDSFARGVQKAKEAAGNFSQLMEKLGTQITNVLVNDITAGLTDILNGTKSVAQGFRDMALSIIKDLEKLIIEAAIWQAIMAATGTPGAGAGTSFLSRLFAPSHHTGAIIGVTPPGPMMWAPSAAWATAPHFHNGSGDYPAILRRGEGVFTPEQMSALAPATGGGSPVSVHVTVNSDGSSRKQSGNADSDARELATNVERVVLATLSKQKRFGGELYQPRNR